MKAILILLISVATTYHSVAHGGQIEQVIFEPDNNGNYVRDDIEELIHNNVSGDQQLIEFLLEYVRLDQESIQNYQNKDIVISNSQKMSAMSACLSTARPDFDTKLLKELFANLRSTMNISLAYIESRGHLGGTTIKNPSETEIDNLCKKYFQ